jgi:dephospho-CoA kinase
MKWFGLTGGIASGKSSVSQILKNEGFAVVDADAIAREVVEAGSPGLSAVRAHFGTEILKPDGGLDRKKLGQLVFGHPEKLLQLENILHPLVKQETLRQRQDHQAKGRDFVFYDVPLLFEKKMEKDFDGIIVVTASDDLQRRRMKARDQLSDAEVSNRLQSQIPLAEKIKRATWVIENHGSLQDLRVAVLDLIQKIQSGKE